MYKPTRLNTVIKQKPQLLIHDSHPYSVSNNLNFMKHAPCIIRLITLGAAPCDKNVRYIMQLNFQDTGLVIAHIRPLLNY